MKRKQQKQTLTPAGATPLVGKGGNDSIMVSDSPPESQEINRRQNKLEMDLNGEAAGCDPVGGQVVPNMAPNQNKTNQDPAGGRSSSPKPPTTEAGHLPATDNREVPSIARNDKAKQGTKQVVEEITQKSVEEILGTEPVRPKHRRPRCGASALTLAQSPERTT